MVLGCMMMDGCIKLTEVSESTGISLSSVKKIVQSLKTKGILRNEGTNRNSRWIIL